MSLTTVLSPAYSHRDEYYVRNWSISLDLYMLLRTLKTIILIEGED
jgi:hypothetical protein